MLLDALVVVDLEDGIPTCHKSLLLSLGAFACTSQGLSEWPGTTIGRSHVQLNVESNNRPRADVDKVRTAGVFASRIGGMRRMVVD